MVVVVVHWVALVVNYLLSDLRIIYGNSKPSICYINCLNKKNTKIKMQFKKPEKQSGFLSTIKICCQITSEIHCTVQG